MSQARSWSRSGSTVLSRVGVGAESEKIIDSSPESHGNARQQTMILDEQLYIFPKISGGGKNKRVAVCR